MSRHALKLFLLSAAVICASCAARRIEMPSYEGRAFSEVLSERNDIRDIEMKFAVLFEKKDSKIKGDAFLDISQSGNMSLRVYSMGFLAMELSSREGRVKSTPPLDRGKKLILTRGLRDCLFWWDIKDFSFIEKGGYYVLERPDREIWIDKKTFLPTRQNVYFGDGKVLNIYYDDPALGEDFWYQSTIRIEYSRYAVTFTIKNMTFKS